MKRTTDILTGYLGDVLALENHLLKAVEQQLNDKQVIQHSSAREFLTELHAILQTHSTRAAAKVAALSGSLSANVKEAVTAATGFAAGLIGKIRPQTASKFLRDDYVVLSACAIEYEMLHASSLAVNDQMIAAMALENLEEITPLIVRLSDIMPAVLVDELVAQVGEVATGSVLIARENTRKAWSNETIHAEHV
jgi:hypothetical protein